VHVCEHACACVHVCEHACARVFLFVCAYVCVHTRVCGLLCALCPSGHNQTMPHLLLVAPQLPLRLALGAPQLSCRDTGAGARRVRTQHKRVAAVPLLPGHTYPPTRLHQVEPLRMQAPIHPPTRPRSMPRPPSDPDSAQGH